MEGAGDVSGGFAGGEALAKLGEDAAKAATKLLTAVGELFGLSEAFESSRHGSGGATGIAAAVGAAPAKASSCRALVQTVRS